MSFFDWFSVIGFTIIVVCIFLGFTMVIVGGAEEMDRIKLFCADNGGEFIQGYGGIFCDGRPFVCGDFDCYFVDHSFVGGVE